MRVKLVDSVIKDSGGLISDLEFVLIQALQKNFNFLQKTFYFYVFLCSNEQNLEPVEKWCPSKIFINTFNLSNLE